MVSPPAGTVTFLFTDIEGSITLAQQHPAEWEAAQLKGLTNPERVWQVETPVLPTDFPPHASLNAIPNNLPLQLTNFIGRSNELAQVRQMLVKAADESTELMPTSRLVTLVGPGGTGKTRLCIRVAAELLDHFADGVCFVELAPLTDYALVPLPSPLSLMCVLTQIARRCLRSPMRFASSSLC